MSAISVWAGGAVPARGRGGHSIQRRVGTLVGRAGLAIATVAFVSPVLLSVEMSFRSNTAINVAPLAWPKSLSLSNFTTAWSAGGLGQALLWSAVIAVVSVMWLTVAGQVLAYYIVRRGNRLASVALLYVMAGLAFPAPSRLLPLYELMLSLHLIGNPISVMLFQGATLTPLSVLIYRSFLQRMPIEYEDAAYVDGAGHLQVLRHVVVPMLWPSSVAVASLKIGMIWNDFFTPLLLVGGSTYATVPVKIYTFVGQYTAQWGDIFAGLTLAVIPVIIVFILLQRHLVEGLGAGLKG